MAVKATADATATTETATTETATPAPAPIADATPAPAPAPAPIVYAGALKAYNDAISAIEHHVALNMLVTKSVANKIFQPVETAYIQGIKRRKTTPENFKAILMVLSAKLAPVADTSGKPVDFIAVSLKGLTADALGQAMMGVDGDE